MKQAARNTMGGMSRPTSRAVVALLLAALVLGLWPAAAQAHRGEQSYLYLDVAREDLAGRVEMPYSDLREVFGLELRGSDEEILAELEANLEMLQAYADEHSALGADGQTWTQTFEGVELLDEGGRSDGDFGYAIFPFTVDVPTAEVPQVLDVFFDPFLDEIDDRDAILLVSNDWRRGVFDEEANEIVIFTPGSRSHTVDFGDASEWRNFTTSIRLGVDHIKTGPDHIFFVMVLLLPSVLIFSAGWKPEPTFGASLWRVLKIATMFTVAHSITFTLAGLDILPLPPSRLVESVIALSIAGAALHNLWPVLRNREWLIAFLFGLFHGMGFAGLVDSLDVSQTTKLVSLLGRNVGIEIGQAVVVLIVFPALFLMRRTRYYRPLFLLGSLALAAISTMWAIERIFERDLDSDRFVDPIVEWPRALWLMAIATAVAYAVYAYEKRNQRLLPVYGDDSDDDDTPPSPEPERELVSV